MPVGRRYPSPSSFTCSPHRRTTKRLFPRHPCSGFATKPDLWAYQKGVTLDFSRPDKPTDNALAEAFNGRFRAECLNQHWFLTLADAREKMEDWRRYYNEERPHGAIGNKSPIMLTKSGDTASPSP